MSYIETLSWGLCVVSPNAPTMSEYNVHGVNGLRYYPDNPVALDFSDHRAHGKAARGSCVVARSARNRAFDDIENFLEAPCGSYAMPKHPLVRAKRRTYVELRALYRAAKRRILSVMHLLRRES
jgi:hypothetical protein